MSNNIFDINNLSDLPKELQKQIKPDGLSNKTKMVLSLFEKKRSLSTDEIIVGIYRVYKQSITRTWVATTCYNLKRSGVIKKDGEYFTLNK